MFTLNAPLAVTCSIIESLSPALKILATIVLQALKEEFFIQKSVKELLFEGYPDLLTSLAPLFNHKIPAQYKFGYMYGKNESNDGLFRVFTGNSDLKKVNSIETMNGLPQLPFWSEPKCNSFSGATNGESFAPLAANQNSLLFFRSFLCRTWELVVNSTIESDLEGLSAYRFYPDRNTFANFSDYPPNSCFVPNDTSIERDVNLVVSELKEFKNSKDKRVIDLDQKLKEGNSIEY